MGEEKLILNDLYEQIIDDISSKGYSVQTKLFPADLLEGILYKIAIIERQQIFVQAGIGNKNTKTINKEQRKDHIYWIDNYQGATEKGFFQVVNNLVDYLNFHCFTGIKGHEFHYAKYENGAYYKKHVDVFKNDSKRKFSMITYLNKDWCSDDGGSLKLYPLGEEEIEIFPEFGTTVFFKSDELLHEVLPTARTRYSITGWLK